MYNLFFAFIILASTIDFRIPGLNYWDEALLIAVPLYYLVKTRKFSVRRDQLTEWFAIIIFVAIGLVSNLLHPGLQDYPVAILKDVIAAVKFPVLMVLLAKSRGAVKQEKIIHDAARMSKYILWVMALFAAVGYIADIGVYLPEIRIVKCYKFFFSHPTFLVSSIIMMTAVLIADGIKGNRVSLMIAALLIFMSGRTKGYIMIIPLLFIMYTDPVIVKRAFSFLHGRLRVKKRYILLGLLFVCAVVYMIGRKKVMGYMRWGLAAARPALYLVGLMLLKEYFPFGSGFGTFASSISGEYYSNIYGKYHIDGVQGITRGNTNYIADTFPPYIYGQFGVVGAAAYVWMIGLTIRYQFRRLKSYNQILAFLFLWIYAIAACTAESFFTNTSGVQLAVVLSVFIGFENPDKTEVDVEQNSLEGGSKT